MSFQEFKKSIHTCIDRTLRVSVKYIGIPKSLEKEINFSYAKVFFDKENKLILLQESKREDGYTIGKRKNRYSTIAVKISREMKKGQYVFVEKTEQGIIFKYKE